MPLAQQLDRAQMTFQVIGGELAWFQVLRYRGTEGLCQLFRFEIELAATDASVTPADVVGKSAVLSVNAPTGTRWFHGLIGRFEVTGQAAAEVHYRAELVPTVWLLTHRYGARIFQQKSVPEIVTDVLQRAGVTTDHFRFALQGQHHPREYCVQYRETDYNFVCRLLEEEGIWWYFEQSRDGHVLVMADSPGGYATLADNAQIPFVPLSGLMPETEAVFRFRLGQSVRPGAVVLDDWNFEKPTVRLQSRDSADRDQALEFFDYPGEYAEQSVGAQLVRLRVEEFGTARVLGVGQSTSARLAPGRKFDLIEHPIEALNGGYLVTAATYAGKQAVVRTSAGGNGEAGLLDAHTRQSVLAARSSDSDSVRCLAEALLQINTRLQRGDATAHRALSHWVYHAGQVSRDLGNVAAAAGQAPLEALAIRNLVADVAASSLIDYDAPVYECRFECIPATVSYRPPRVTPWPVMRGAQTARVVGPSGEEIYTDKYGRVKVQFNWDREGKFDDQSSCWIRVSQGAAGGQYGMMFLPRIGQEVLVDFLEGDPDRPIITGRVYNADQMPPYTLPDEKTKSVIKTNSTKGGGGTNEICFEDLKGKEQILVYAQQDLHVRVNNDRVEDIGHNRHLTVTENQYELVKKAKHSEVKLDWNAKIGGNHSLEVVGDVAEKVSGNHSEAAANIYLKGNQKVVVEGGSSLTLKVGGNFVKIDASGVTILGTQVKINSGGAADMGTTAALAAPETTIHAATARPGSDVVYSGGEQLAAGAAVADLAGYEWQPENVTEKKTSWIEIELVDEAGQPVPGEAYEVTAPDGKTVARGALDKNGRAHVEVDKAGTCQISFPNLDNRAWERN